ncbi:MAG: ribosome maturation factor RimM [Candidatus Nitrospinota bacterium M3_3B_026]
MASRDGRDEKNAGDDEGLSIALGRLIRPHGLKGEMKLKPYASAETLSAMAGKPVTVEPETDGPSFSSTLVRTRGVHSRLIARIKGVNTPERARELTPAILKARRDLMPARPGGGYYPEELLGMEVRDMEGGRIGEIEDVFPAGERDVWVVRKDDGSEMMIPHIPEIVKEIDMKSRRAVIEPMDQTEA